VKTRLLLAALLAIALHALLFKMEVKWVEQRESVRPLAKAVKLFLVTKKPEPEPEVAPIKEIERAAAVPPPTPEVPRPKPVQEKKSSVKSLRKERPKAKVVAPPQAAPAPKQPSPPAGGTYLPREAPPDTRPVQQPVRTSPSPPAVASTPPVIQEAIPDYRSSPPPEYPMVARRRGYEGTVVLKVLVNKEGRVADIQLSRSCGYPVLDRSALAAVKAWIFEPAKKDGAAVEMWVSVPIRFQLK